MPVLEENAEACRRQVQRILASHEFVTSRQLRDFLQYVSEAAFEGRTHLDQIEIAEKVLQRGKDFNPLDDASVRKLGTALRQRLDRFYETDGSQDPVRISLPVRSYVPVFELRNSASAIEPPVITLTRCHPRSRTSLTPLDGGRWVGGRRCRWKWMVVQPPAGRTISLICHSDSPGRHHAPAK